MHVFLHGIRIAGFHFARVFTGIPIAGKDFACIFMWYSHSWGSFCMYFYGYSYSWGALCMYFYVYSHSWGPFCMYFYRYSYRWGLLAPWGEDFLILAPPRDPAARCAQIVDFHHLAASAALGRGFPDSGIPSGPCGQMRSDR